MSNVPALTNRAIKVAEILRNFADKASNLIQGADVVANRLEDAPQGGGVKYNSHVFSFSADAEKAGEKPELVTAASPKQPSKQSSATTSMFSPRGALRRVLVIRVGNEGLQFGIALRASNPSAGYESGQIVLSAAQGFDSSVGNQAEFEFGGVEWGPGRYLLTLMGQITPKGLGPRRLVGAVIVDKQGKLTPHGSWHAETKPSPTSNSLDPRLATSRGPVGVADKFDDNLGWDSFLGGFEISL